jgi:peptidoglycan LD-endopeptidase LytH
MGAFLFALIYSTKPGSDTSITLARLGDTALVVDTAGNDSTSVGSADASAPGLGDTIAGSAIPLPPPSSGGSSSPVVAPSDLAAFKSQNPIIPVAGIAPKDLVDSFDDMRGGTRRHNALDIMAARNTPVLAAVSGTILQLHNSVPGGLTIYQADATSRFVMMYGHLDSFRPGLVKGQSVRRGEILGFVGSTGNANPLAPHLHFQLTRNDNLNEWWKGTPLNPFPIFRPAG